MGGVGERKKLTHGGVLWADDSEACMPLGLHSKLQFGGNALAELEC